jgi:transcription elongation factor GreA-like protein
MKAPTNTPQCYWYDQWDVQVKAYAEKHGLRYYNFLENIDEIGLDYTTDTYDQGFHLNLSGAEKLASYFGKILTEELELIDHRGDAEYEKVWTKLSQQYDQIRKTQEKLLEENGKLTGFTGLE